MKHLIFSFFLSLSFSRVVFAEGGISVGNGGHGVICPTFIFEDSRGLDQTLETLDLFEARRMYGHKPWSTNTYASMASLRQKTFRAHRILEEKKKELRALLGSNRFDSFFEAAFSFNSYIKDELPLTEDTGPVRVAVPRNCDLVQFAIFQKSKRGIRLFIDRDYVGMLNENELAALFLHESLHNLFTHENSTTAIRDFVIFAMANNEFKKRNLERFKALIRGR